MWIHEFLIAELLAALILTAMARIIMGLFNVEMEKKHEAVFWLVCLIGATLVMAIPTYLVGDPLQQYCHDYHETMTNTEVYQKAQEQYFTNYAAAVSNQDTYIRNQATEANNRGLSASVIGMSPSKTEFREVTNIAASVTTVGGISHGAINATYTPGSDFTVVTRFVNSGRPTTAWEWKAEIITPKEETIPAIIPSLIFASDLVSNFTAIHTITGDYVCTRENNLLQSLSFKRLDTGDAIDGWLMIHVNGITAVPDGSRFVITCVDVYGRQTKIDHLWKLGQ